MSRRMKALVSLAGLTLLAGAAGAPWGSDDSRPTAVAFSSDSAPPLVPVHVSYLPEVDEELMEHVERTVRQRSDEYNRELYGNQFNANDRWGLGQAQGTSVTLRWSIPADGLFVPSGLGEASGSNSLNAMLTTIFGNLEAGKDRIRAAINAWGDLTGNTLIEVVDNGVAWGNSGPFNGGACNADIRIVAKNFGGSWQGVLAYNFFPDHGDMVINRGHQSDYSSASNNYRFLRNTVCHENGHGIGLSHVCPIAQTRLMEPFLSTRFDMIQHDDLRGGQRNYGDYMEVNDSVAQASDLGTVNAGQFRDHDDLSIDDNTDIDFFKFTVPAGMQATINVQPIGFSYQDWDQNNQTGQCNTSGPTVNSLIVHDLRVELRNDNGNSILVNQNANGAGSAEVISDFVLPGPGTYHIGVFGTSANDIQIYDLRLDIEPAQGAPFCADSVVVNRGLPDGGTQADACGSNDSYWFWKPDALAASVTAPINLEFVGHASVDTGSQIRFASELAATTTGIVLNMALFNYDTNQWEAMVVPNIPLNDTVHTLVKSSSVGAYIGAGNEVRGRLTFTRPAGVPPLWFIQIDDVHFEVVP